MPDLKGVGEATTGREAVELACSTRSDVILMGIRMSDLDGMEAIRLITVDEDRVGVRVLVLTTFELDENALRARHTPSGAADLPPQPENVIGVFRCKGAMSWSSPTRPAATMTILWPR